MWWGVGPSVAAQWTPAVVSTRFERIPIVRQKAKRVKDTLRAVVCMDASTQLSSTQHCSFLIIGSAGSVSAGTPRLPARGPRSAGCSAVKLRPVPGGRPLAEWGDVDVPSLRSSAECSPAEYGHRGTIYRDPTLGAKKRHQTMSGPYLHCFGGLAISPRACVSRILWRSHDPPHSPVVKPMPWPVRR